MNHANPGALAVCRSVFRLTAIGLALFAGGVLIAWQAGALWLTNLDPTWATMKPNTALGFLLAALGLWCVGRAAKGGRIGAVGFGGGAAAIGALTLFQHVAGRDLGIDRWFRVLSPLLESDLTAVSPGRMSPMAAMNLLLLGLAVGLMAGERSRRAIWSAQVLALIAALSAFVALMGYLYGMQALKVAVFFTSTSIHTTLFSLWLSVGVMCARPAEGLMALFNAGTAGGALLRRLFLPVTLLPIATHWLEIEGERRGLFPEGFGWLLDAAVTVVLLGALMWLVARSVHEKDEARQAAERELQQSEERYRQLVEMSPLAIVVKDARRIEFANPAAGQLVGAGGTEAMVGKSPFVFLHPENRAQFEQGICRVIAERVSLPPTEQRLVRMDGTPINVEVSATPVEYHGRVLAQIVARDVTESRKAELALRSSEERFQLIADAISEVLWLTDRALTRMDYVSPAYERVWGRSREELAGEARAFLAAVHPEDRAALVDKLDRTGEGGGFEHEYRLALPDGTTRWIWHHAYPVRAAVGEARYVHVSQDITERKRVQDELRASVERLQLLAQATGDAIWDWDIVRDVTWWSDTLRQRFGYAHDTVPTFEAWLAHVHPEDREHAVADFRAAVRDNVPAWSSEYRFRKADGSYARILDRACGLVGSEGKLVRIIGSIVDISELRRLEDEARLLAQAVESTSEMISITGLDDRFVWVNRSFLSAYGYREDEVLGQTPALITGPSLDGDASLPDIRATAMAGVWRGELMNRRKDGSQFPIALNATSVRDRSGRVVALMGVAQDITARRDLENRLRHTQKMEAVGQLAGGVAHDFNNMLTAILGQATLMGMEPGLSVAARESLEEIARAVHRAASITRQLLLFSRREVMQLSRFDLNYAVEQIVRMLQRLIGEDVSLRLRLTPLPLPLHADAGMIDQVLMNLAVNARDAMPGGGALVIETAEQEFSAAEAAELELSGGRYACLSVSDTGTGISPEVLPHIFEPFFTTKEAGKGTGLGLATVFGVVKRHKGAIKVYSEVGDGTTFRIYFPLGAPVDASPQSAVSRDGRRGRGELILLVEDDPAVRETVEPLLVAAGYCVVTAGSGNGALALWPKISDRVRILITDIVLPGGLSGAELARELRERRGELGVVFMSGYSARLAGQSLPLPAGYAFVQKPFEVTQLLDAIDRVRRRSDSE